MVAALAAGWLLAGASSASSSTPVAVVPAASVSPAAPVTGAVDVTGAPIGGALGWTVERVQAGRYALSFDADLTLEVLSWDVPASATVKPVADGGWLVDFLSAGAPVDTAFSFTAGLPGE